MSFYDRQKNLDIKAEGKSIVVIGCGGIGFHVAKMLAMSGVENLYLFDRDFFREHNMNRIDIPLKALDMNKAKVTKMIINQMRPSCRVIHFEDIFDDFMVSLEDIDWIVDCSDRFKDQIRHQEIAEKNGVKYCKPGYDGDNISINDKVAQWDVGDTPNEGYVITPSWVVPAVITAALTVGKILKYENKELGTTVDKLYTRGK